ncbi:MAG: hypothetical protein Kow00108_05070 [Calditrichia bacterium]
MKLIFVALRSEWKYFFEAHKKQFMLLYGNDREMVAHYPDFDLLVYQTGIGPDLPLIYLDNILSQFNITEIYNIGFCGIHHSSLEIGSIVIPKTVSLYQSDHTSYSTDRNSYISNKTEGVEIPQLMTFPFVVTMDKVSLPEETIAIDMEAFYLFQKLSEKGKKLMVIKIVSDYLTAESLGDLIKTHLSLLRKKQHEIMNIIAGIHDK